VGLAFDSKRLIAQVSEIFGRFRLQTSCFFSSLYLNASVKLKRNVTVDFFFYLNMGLVFRRCATCELYVCNVVLQREFFIFFHLEMGE
jgi:hypothetical protein